MFVINQLSDYISVYYNDSMDNNSIELNDEQLKQHKERSSLKGAFLDKETVCIGYAMAFQRCMNALGVQSKIVCGKTGNENTESNQLSKYKSTNHAWNVVKIKENWYNLDVTWLSSYKDIASGKRPKIDDMTEQDIINSYILSSDTDFVNHHKIESNGIDSTETLKEKFKIYENTKIYKNVLEEYDAGIRNNMLQVKLENNTSKEEQLINRNNKNDKEIEEEKEWEL